MKLRSNCCSVCFDFLTDGDFEKCICLSCIDYYTEKYGYIFDLLQSDYEPCNDKNRSAEKCYFCIWSNGDICAYKVMCSLKNKKQQGN